VGIRNVYIMPEGISGWIASGKPAEREEVVL